MPPEDQIPGPASRVQGQGSLDVRSGILDHLLRWFDLALVLAAAATAVLLTMVDGSNPLARATFGALLVLVLPGYAVVAAGLPRQSFSAERLVLSLGASLAVAALGGLVLNLLPPGLQQRPWALLLGSVTVAATAIAAMRRRRQPAFALERAGVRLGIRQAVPLALALVVVTSALGVARAGAARPRTAFTQVWLLPVARDRPDEVRIGLGSGEQATTSYRLEVVAGSEALYQWPTIALRPGEQWEVTAVLPADLPNGVPVEAVLYRADAPETSYRRVALWRGGSE